ncbi:hypothetical protein Hanom_Chr09g00761821 [Helianthus anomalus]
MLKLKKQKKASPPPSSTKPTDADVTNASADVRETAVETPVVSAQVSQSSATIHFNTPPSTQPPPTPQRFPSQPPSPPKVPPPPKFAYVRKRKFVVVEDDKEIPSPIPLPSVPIQVIPSSSLPPKSTLTPPTCSLPFVIPLAAKYPLELLVAQDEIESFFKIEDPSKRTFPSLYGFRQPKNLDEYLKMKARQAEVTAREESKWLGDRKSRFIII